MLIRTLFFFFFMALGAYVPYIALYFQRIGIAGSFIGILLAINPITETVATPAWGMLADALGWQRRIFLFCALTASILVPLYMVAESIWSFALLQFLIFALICPLLPIINRAVLNLQYEEKMDYGQARIFGCLGFAVVAMLVGLAAESAGLQIMFIFTSVGLFVLFLGGLFFPAIEYPAASNFAEDLKRLMSHRRLLFFLGSTVLLHGGMVAASTYFGILMDYLGAGEGIMGFSWAGAALIEIPLFYFSSLFLIRLGLNNIILASYVLSTLQITLYLLVSSPLGGLAVHLSRGFFFPLFYIAGINFVQGEAPRELQTTGQTLFAACNFGLAGGLGNLLGGIFYEHLGIHAVYYLGTLMALTGIFIFAIGVYNQPDLRRDPPGREYGAG